MTPWQISIQNLETIPPDTRPKCKECGARFEPHTFAWNAVYCTDECRLIGKTAQKREAALRRKIERIAQGAMR